MASYPGSKVHRVSRRRLGRGQHVQVGVCSVVPAVFTTTITLTFDVPVVVSGNIPLNLSVGGPLVSQEQTSPVTVVQHYTSSAAAADWSVDSSAPVRTFQGGLLAPASGTF